MTVVYGYFEIVDGEYVTLKEYDEEGEVISFDSK